MSLRNVPRTVPEQIAELRRQISNLTRTVVRAPSPTTPVSITFAAAGTSVMGDVADEGSGQDSARASHQHDRGDDWVMFWGQVNP